MIKKNYSIYIDIELKAQLDGIAKDSLVSSSSIINDLISDYIQKVKNTSKKKVSLSEPDEMTPEEQLEWINKMEKKAGL